MRSILLAVALTMILCGPARAEGFKLPIEVDKAAHFGLSYAITDQLMRAGMSPEQAVIVTLFIGWAKELADGRIDAGDLSADATGSLAAAYLRIRVGW